jgi:hypothetical protein
MNINTTYNFNTAKNNCKISKIKSINIDNFLLERGFKTGDIIMEFDDNKYIYIVYGEFAISPKHACSMKLNNNNLATINKVIPREFINYNNACEVAQLVSEGNNLEEFNDCIINLEHSKEKRTLIKVPIDGKEIWHIIDNKDVNIEDAEDYVMTTIYSKITNSNTKQIELTQFESSSFPICYLVDKFGNKLK